MLKLVIPIAEIHAGLSYEEAHMKLLKAGFDTTKNVASYIDEVTGDHVFFQTRKGNV